MIGLGMGAKKQNPQVEAEVANTAAMLYILGLSAPTDLYRFLNKGLAVKVGPAGWNWVETCRKLFKFYREIAAGRADEEGNSAVKANIGLRAAQERLTQIKADQLSKKLIPIEDVETAWAEVAINTRQIILSIPGRIQFSIPHLTSQDRVTMENVCRDVLEEAAGGKMPPVGQ
jgi:phage terminase Nu1 subunit (DNA packaging protein)